MSNYEQITEIRNLETFRYLDLCDSANWIDLIICSGEQDQLTITGPENLVTRIRTKLEDDTLIIRLEGTLVDKIRDALTTSLSRKKIIYHLTVKQLEGIELCGLIRLDTSELKSGNPVIRQFNPWTIPMPGPILFK